MFLFKSVSPNLKFYFDEELKNVSCPFLISFFVVDVVVVVVVDVDTHNFFFGSTQKCRERCEDHTKTDVGEQGIKLKLRRARSRGLPPTNPSAERYKQREFLARDWLCNCCHIVVCTVL